MIVTAASAVAAAITLSSPSLHVKQGISHLYWMGLLNKNVGSHVSVAVEKGDGGFYCGHSQRLEYNN